MTALLCALGPGVLFAAPAGAVTTGTTEVSYLEIAKFGDYAASWDASGPDFWFGASDPDGVATIVGRWCSTDQPTYCVSPTWTADAPGTTDPAGRVDSDIPADAPLGEYGFVDIVFTDDAGNTTAFEPDGTVLVNGAPSGYHDFNLHGTLTVVDQDAPTVQGIQWVGGDDTASLDTGDHVSLDVLVDDNWRDALAVNVAFASTRNQDVIRLSGRIPALESGAQHAWLRATSDELDATYREGGTYVLTAIQVFDERNSTYYAADGTTSVREYGKPGSQGTHSLAMGSFPLRVSEDSPHLMSVLSAGDGSLRARWKPVILSDGSEPSGYRVEAVPLEPTSSGHQWQLADQPTVTVPVPADQTAATVDGLDNGRKYAVHVVAVLAGGEVRGDTQRVTALPTFELARSVAVFEGDARSVPAVITVRTSSPPLYDVTEQLDVQPLGVEDDDYGGAPPSVTIPAGERTATVVVPVLGDTLKENDEQLSVGLHGYWGETPGGHTTVVTIHDDDRRKDDLSLSIGSVDVLAPEPGDSPAVLTVTLQQPSDRVVRVRYRTVDGTGVAGTDYEAKSGVLRFRPGQVAKKIAIPIHGGAGAPDGFTVRLHHPRQATLWVPVASVGIDRGALAGW